MKPARYLPWGYDMAWALSLGEGGGVSKMTPDVCEGHADGQRYR